MQTYLENNSMSCFSVTPCVMLPTQSDKWPSGFEGLREYENRIEESNIVPCLAGGLRSNTAHRDDCETFQE